MPRIGRIEMVGKREARENETRTEELRELACELRREWRNGEHGLPDRYACYIQDGRAA
jgi:hypothetical protein